MRTPCPIQPLLSGPKSGKFIQVWLYVEDKMYENNFFHIYVLIYMYIVYKGKQMQIIQEKGNRKA